MSPLSGLAYGAPYGSPSLRYFESARKSWGRADRRSKTKSGREGVPRFYERRMVILRSFHPFQRHILCMIAKHPVSPGQFDWQNDRHHAARFAFLLSAHPWALKLLTFRLILLILPYPGGALPSVDSSPNTISLTCPSANTHFVRTQCGLGTDRSKLDTGLRPTESNGIIDSGNADLNLCATGLRGCLIRDAQ